MTAAPPSRAAAERGSAREVFLAFLKLGLSSFGGPIAHLGYFRRAFVERRRWLGEAQYAQLLALCQFLPGPASSQLGFSIGLLRAGWPGAVAAFAGFTLPSALLMAALAALGPQLGGAWSEAVVHGLKLVAVAVVGQGLLRMLPALTPDAPRIALAIAALLVSLGRPAWTQLLVVAGGAALGPWLCRAVKARPGAAFALPYGTRGAGLLLAVCGLLLAAALLVDRHDAGPAAAAAAFYRAGALVFGGGHVVLPLLDHAVVDPGWVDANAFLAGYGAAQAMPGPMFSLAAYLGELHGGPAGAFVSTLSIFLPGLLLIAGVLPFWRSLAAHDGAARMLAGVNAAVVGLLGAAFYAPVCTGALHAPVDFAIAGSALALSTWPRWPALATVGLCMAASLLLRI